MYERPVFIYDMAKERHDGRRDRDEWLVDRCEQRRVLHKLRHVLDEG